MVHALACDFGLGDSGFGCRGFGNGGRLLNGSSGFRLLGESAHGAHGEEGYRQNQKKFFHSGV